jgi:hypothetical protein
VRTSSSTRWFVNLFVVSVLANAVLGIWALLSGDFGETQGKVLGTSFLVSAAMLSVLLNIPAIRGRALYPAPLVGAVTGAAGFSLFIALMWIEPADDRWFKLAGSFLVVAAAATLVSSLALAAVPVHLQWLQWVADGLIAILAVTVVVGLWAEPDVDWYARLLGIEGVLVAAMTLLLPVLSRFSSLRPAEPGREAIPPGPPEVRFCPSCGHPVAPGPLGTGVATHCEACGLTFAVTAAAEALSGSIAETGYTSDLAET